jgi:uncharacterized short protein YbdD (DUF466 family)
MNELVAAFRRLWHALRRITDDDAYERYRQHHFRCHPDAPLLDRQAFYLAEQQRKWSGVSRCC